MHRFGVALVFRIGKVNFHRSPEKERLLQKTNKVIIQNNNYWKFKVLYNWQKKTEICKCLTRLSLSRVKINIKNGPTCIFFYFIYCNRYNFWLVILFQFFFFFSHPQCIAKNFHKQKSFPHHENCIARQFYPILICIHTSMLVLYTYRIDVQWNFRDAEYFFVYEFFWHVWCFGNNRFFFI